MLDKVPFAAPDAVARDAWHGVERPLPRNGTFDRAWVAAEAAALAGWTRTRGRACRAIVRAVDAAAPDLTGLSDADLRAYAKHAGRAALRADIKRAAVAAPLLAVVREAAHRTLGMRHYDVQLMGGFAMLKGQLAEMQTGEGKTLTATLAAGAMALMGRPVHVVTVNDYLAERDAEEMRPVYEALGLSVGLLQQGMDPAIRQRNYQADITYCTNKELAFDYLRDRLNPATGSGPHARRPSALYDRLMGTPLGGGLLRGLAFALIDEADSVLIDEARTPLILSGQGPANFDPELLEAAAELIEHLEPRHYRVLTTERRIELKLSGADVLEEHAPSVLSNRVVREELAVKALTARFLFERDQEYLVRDGKVQIVDEYTGRVMPDRFWTDGLHQLIELKEGVEPSGGRVTLARTTYQRFFRRYHKVAGMTGTAREVAAELWRTYGLATVTIPTHRPVRRRVLPARVLATSQAKWRAIGEQTAKLHERGIPVLIGTRSVATSETAAQILTQRGIPHIVLSAAQDAEEADKIAQAGQPGQVTVATNMAGRGADIKLGEGVAELGGLHVIMSDLHDTKRVDRQLAGRAGRQGNPGWFRPYLSMEDSLMQDERSVVFRFLGGVGFRRLVLRLAQRRAERRHTRMRRDLLRQDEVFSDAMSFSGQPD